MKAVVSTTIIQEIEVPEGTTQQEVMNFLADNQSFRDALVGLSDENQQFRITDVDVESEHMLELGDQSFDPSPQYY
jgi:hypothetical protein